MRVAKGIWCAVKLTVVFAVVIISPGINKTIAKCHHLQWIQVIHFCIFLAFSQGKKYPARLRGLRFYRVGEQRHGKVSKFQWYPSVYSSIIEFCCVHPILLSWTWFLQQCTPLSPACSALWIFLSLALIDYAKNDRPWWPLDSSQPDLNANVKSRRACTSNPTSTIQVHIGPKTTLGSLSH